MCKIDVEKRKKKRTSPYKTRERALINRAKMSFHRNNNNSNNNKNITINDIKDVDKHVNM